MPNLTNVEPYNPLHKIVSPEALNLGQAGAIECLRGYADVLTALRMKAIDDSGRCNVKAAMGLLKHMEYIFDLLKAQTGKHPLDLKEYLDIKGTDEIARIERAIMAVLEQRVSEMSLEQARRTRDLCEARIGQLGAVA